MNTVKTILFSAFFCSVCLEAAEIRFSGIMGQGQKPGAPLISSASVEFVRTAWDHRIVFFANRNQLCELKPDKTVVFLTKIPSRPENMMFDGKDLFVYCFNQTMYRIVPGEPYRVEKLFSTKGFYRQIAVIPADSKSVFASKGKIFYIKNKQVHAWDLNGKDLGKVMELPKNLKGGAVYNSMEFLPETGDLIVGGGYPDMMIYRFGPDGKEIQRNGWPVNMTAERLQVNDGKLWGLSGHVQMFAENNFKEERITVAGGKEAYLNGVVSNGQGGWYVSSAAGLKEYKESDPHKPVWRLGGIPNLLKLAAGQGIVTAVPVNDLRMLALNEDDFADEPLLSGSDYFWMYRSGASWTGSVSGIAEDKGSLWVFNSKAGDMYVLNPRMTEFDQSRYRWRQVKPNLDLKVTSDIAISDHLLYVLSKGKLFAGEKSMTPILKEVNVTLPDKASSLCGAGDGGLFIANANRIVLFKNGKITFTLDVPEGIRGFAGTDHSLVVSSANELSLYSVPDGRKLASFKPDSVDGGFEAGPVALDGKWIFLYDRKNARLLRLKIKR